MSTNTDLRHLLACWAALDGGAWNVARYEREKAELIAKTEAALSEAAIGATPEPVAWRYRYHQGGKWHLAHAPGNDPEIEEQALYAGPASIGVPSDSQTTQEKS